MARARREDEWARVTALVQWQAVHLVGKAPDAEKVNPYLPKAEPAPEKTEAQVERENRNAWKLFDEYMAEKARK